MRKISEAGKDSGTGGGRSSIEHKCTKSETDTETELEASHRYPIQLCPTVAVEQLFSKLPSLRMDYLDTKKRTSLKSPKGGKRKGWEEGLLGKMWQKTGRLSRYGKVAIGVPRKKIGSHHARAVLDQLNLAFEISLFLSV